MSDRDNFKPGGQIRVPIDASPSIQQAFRELNVLLERAFGSRNVNHSGRRIINAGDAVDDQDYVTLADLKRYTGRTNVNSAIAARGTGTGSGGGGTGGGGTGGIDDGPNPPIIPYSEVEATYKPLVLDYGAAHSAELLTSCQGVDPSPWAYMDGLIAYLQSLDSRWGFNAKRGNTSDPSKDAGSFYHGPLGTQTAGDPNVFVIDFIGSHCENPTATFTHVTGPGGWLPTRPGA